MRITASEYAARKGLTARAVRFQLQKGKLPGRKEVDPETGVETWYVELPDPKEDITDPAVVTGNDHGNTAGNGFPGLVEILSTLQRQHQEEVGRLHRENLELAGRCGFLQARVQDLEGEIKLLKAPAEMPAAEVTTHPAESKNGKDLDSERPARPWWKFWA